MSAPAAARPSSEDRIRAALWFAEQGFGVFSVWSTTATGICRCPLGAACTQSGKHPVTAHGFHDATTDPARIRTLLSAGSEPNYGLVCPDGVLALDVDGEGVARLAEIEAKYGPLPPTLRTQTAHGEHVFLRWPADVPRPIGQLFGFVTRWGAGAGAGYVIGPRSVHASGAVYTPVGGAFAIAQMPDAWSAAAIESKPQAQPGAFTIEPGGYELPESVPAGKSRYEAILAYTAHLYNREIDVDEMWSLVRDRLAPRFELGLPEAELRSRFDRTVAALPGRLGPPAKAARAVRPRTTEEVAASSIDAADLLELDIPPLEWIVQDLLPEGTTVIAGPPKLGKSCLVYQIAVEVALGGELLGRAISQGSVLYLALEDGKRRGQTRLQASLGDRVMPRGRLEVRWSSARLGEGLEDEIVTWLDQHPDARLVAIDTLQRVRARADARRNAYEVDVEDLGRLQNLFRDRSVGLLIVHHSKKEAGDDFLASVSGTYGITGSADTTLVIQRKRLEAFGKLVVTGRDVPEIEESVRFDGMLWQAAPRSIAEASFERAEVYKVVEAEGPIFPAAIAERIGSTRQAVQNLVTQMVTSGSIMRTSGGYAVATIRIVETSETPTEGATSRGSSVSGVSDPSRAHTHAGVPGVSGVSGVSEEVGETGETRGTRTTRGRAGAREAEPTLTLVRDSVGLTTAGWCLWLTEHANRHRDVLTDAPWCEICSPRENA